jgi:murein DD-endopeptidase MepM/ murein hydrolase activator NlpD
MRWLLVPLIVLGLVLKIVFGVLRLLLGLHGDPMRMLVGVVLVVAFVGVLIGRAGGPGAVGAQGALTAGDPFGGSCKPVVTQPYGPTNLVGEPIVNGVRTHTGIDLACPAGTPVHSVSAGRAHVGFDSGFGNSVVVETGGYFVRYAHLSAPAVQDGATVQAGSLIGWEGSTGFSTGPHLHFEVDQGAASVQRSVDPAPYLSGRGLATRLSAVSVRAVRPASAYSTSAAAADGRR